MGRKHNRQLHSHRNAANKVRIKKYHGIWITQDGDKETWRLLGVGLAAALFIWIGLFAASFGGNPWFDIF